MREKQEGEREKEKEKAKLRLTEGEIQQTETRPWGNRDQTETMSQ